MADARAGFRFILMGQTDATGSRITTPSKTLEYSNRTTDHNNVLATDFFAILMAVQ